MIQKCETSPHGWTLDTLEEFLSQKIKAQADLQQAATQAVKEQSNAAMTAAGKAIEKAEQSTEKRFDSVNEFRKTLSDQATDFLSKAEYYANHSALVDKVNILQSRIDSREGKSEGVGASWGVIVGVVGLVYSAVATGVLLLRILH